MVALLEMHIKGAGKLRVARHIFLKYNQDDPTLCKQVTALKRGEHLAVRVIPPTPTHGAYESIAPLVTIQKGRTAVTTIRRVE